MKKKKRGRPPTKPSRLRDGYYLEVRNEGMGTGIKIQKETEREMLTAAEEYRKTNKKVLVLGLYKNGKPISEKNKLK
ncbi:MAG: hypothetical protein V1781_05935 [Bacteroidota bacterium]